MSAGTAGTIDNRFVFTV
jgi:hypothetical protein